MAVVIDLCVLRQKEHLELFGKLENDFISAQLAVAPHRLEEIPQFRLVCDLTGAIIVVQFVIAFKLVAACDLCLKEITVDLDYEFEQVFSWGGDFDSDEVELIPFSSTTLDVAPAILDAIVCAQPYKIICSEDCRGLCGQCGKNLNEGNCACQRNNDSRWNKLADYNKSKG